MVNADVHEKVAAEITAEMDRLHRAFLTVTKLEITTALRRLGGQPRTRVGRSSADNVEAALERRGYKVFPALADVRTDEAVRIYRRGRASCIRARRRTRSWRTSSVRPRPPISY